MKKLTTRQVFSQMLVKLRKDKGISRKTLAEAIGVSSASIGYYENAERAPDIEVLVKIADYFKVTCDELLKGVKSPNKNIYKDLWLSDSALNTLRNLKKIEPINEESQVSYLLEFFNKLLENTSGFTHFISVFYQYAIGFDAPHIVLCHTEIDTDTAIDAEIIYDDMLNINGRNLCTYGDYLLFETMLRLRELVEDNDNPKFAYKNLIEYENYRINLIEKKLTEKRQIKEASDNGKHNPTEE